MKKKIAISIDKGVLERVDSSIDGGNLRSRSQALEYFLRKGIESESIKEAVILLRGSQQDLALQPFMGEVLIHKQVELFAKHGITKIYLVTQKPSKRLREELLGSNVEIIDKEANGNANAILALRNKISSDFIVMSGDTFNDFDLERMMKKHKSVAKVATMGLMTREKGSDYGTAILDGDLVIDFKEKTKKISSHIVNAGIYIFKPEIFDLITGNSLEREVFPNLAKMKELVGFFTYGEYYHLG